MRFINSIFRRCLQTRSKTETLIADQPTENSVTPAGRDVTPSIQGEGMRGLRMFPGCYPSLRAGAVFQPNGHVSGGTVWVKEVFETAIPLMTTRMFRMLSLRRAHCELATA